MSLPENVTYNEVVRQALTPDSYSQAFTAYEGFGPALVLLVLVPLLFNFLYAGFLGEWSRENYKYVFAATVVVTGMMLVAFPYLLMVL